LILKTGHLFLSTNQTFQTNHTDSYTPQTLRVEVI
jgi:hypothetical protein